MHLVNRQVLECILNTDMQYHFQTVGRLENFYELHGNQFVSFFNQMPPGDGPVPQSALDSPSKNLQTLLPSAQDPKHRLLILEAFLHAADISNPVKELAIYQGWVGRVCDEFFQQGDKEKELGRECSPMCDRDSTDIPMMQVGFIEFIVAPMMKGDRLPLTR